MIELHINKKNINKTKLLHILKHNKVLCNIYPYDSIVLNNKTKRHNIETGFKIEVFDIKNKTLIKLWDELTEGINIHCIYIKLNGFEGCITKYPYYLQQCKEYGIKPLTCSEYD